MKLNDLILYEVFNKPAKWKWVSKHDLQWKAEFVVGDLTYRYLVMEDMHTSGWEIDFYLKTKKFSVVTLTGTGNEFTVFSTVIDITKDFIKRNKDINEFVIRGDKSEKGRESLYQKLIKKFATELKFDFKKESARGITEFRITKKK